jgi:phospho-2-dehydro-3-deoxyheptonate aldolase
VKELLQASAAEVEQINRQRAEVAPHTKGTRGSKDARLLAVMGPCSADGNRLPNGELAGVDHNRRLGTVCLQTGHLVYAARFDPEKPRTSTGMTGLLHQPDGVQTTMEAIHALHAARVPIAAEIVSDAGAAALIPHLTVGRIGAREVSATAPRYAVRPTDQDLEQGIHPLPVLIKNDQGNNLKHTINALRTIRSETPESRLQFGYDGPMQHTTHANPFTGDHRPSGDLADVIAEEIYAARELLDREFGEDEIAIHYDLSHAHARYGHPKGGELGQLAVAAALMDLIQRGIPVDGISAETYLLPGKQGNDGTIPGLSITDACIRQARAEELLLDAGRAWAARPLEDDLITV